MAIKFQTNVPQTLTFPWGDFLPIRGFHNHWNRKHR